MSHRTEIKKDDTKDSMAENFSKETYALTNEQKERIYSTISRKLNIEMTDSTKAITGVEKCSRNSLFHIVSTAVSAAVLIIGLGINFTLMHNMKKSISEISVRDDNVAASGTTAQSAQEEMPLFTEPYKAVVNIPVTTAVQEKAVSVSNSERILTAVAKTTAITETTVTESETTAETTEPETTETEIAESEPETESYYQEDTAPQSETAADENEELRNTAEFLIAEYDNIVDIKTFNILDEDSEEKLICIHEQRADGYGPYTMTYRPVDPEKYSDMGTMKDYYYTVICSSKNEDSCFGPEFSTEEYPERPILSWDAPEYAYITYNGILYGLNLTRQVFTVRTDEPAVISNVGAYGFTAEKKYKDTRDENKIVNCRFSIVKDTKTGEYVILNINYD